MIKLRHKSSPLPHLHNSQFTLWILPREKPWEMLSTPFCSNCNVSYRSVEHFLGGHSIDHIMDAIMCLWKLSYVRHFLLGYRLIPSKRDEQCANEIKSRACLAAIGSDHSFVTALSWYDHPYLLDPLIASVDVH